MGFKSKDDENQLLAVRLGQQCSPLHRIHSRMFMQIRSRKKLSFFGRVSTNLTLKSTPWGKKASMCIVQVARVVNETSRKLVPTLRPFRTYIHINHIFLLFKMVVISNVTITTKLYYIIVRESQLRVLCSVHHI